MSTKICIAGNKTIADWHELKQKLQTKKFDESAWDQAKSLFDLRLQRRYFDPIEAIRAKSSDGSPQGEGFAICTLICSLIEAIETFYQGTNFSIKPSKPYEYGFGSSRSIFRNFLTKRKPFDSYFDESLADDFYHNVRCALLHEACTRSGWVINIRGSESISIKGKAKSLNRSLFVSDLKECIKLYKEQLYKSSSLREAFVRKFDGICHNSS